MQALLESIFFFLQHDSVIFIIWRCSSSSAFAVNVQGGLTMMPKDANQPGAQSALALALHCKRSHSDCLDNRLILQAHSVY